MSVFVQLYQSREDQPVSPRHQRANAVGKLFGQHRQYLARQINAGRPFVGLAVERRPFADVVRHVGDVNPHQVAPVFQALQVDCVVKVLGVGAVNSENVLVAKIAPLSQSLRRNLFSNPGRFRQHLLGKCVAQVKVVDDGLGFRFGSVTLPQVLAEDAKGFLFPGLFGVLDVHHYARAFTQVCQAFGRKQQPVVVALVVRP